MNTASQAITKRRLNLQGMASIQFYNVYYDPQIGYGANTADQQISFTSIVRNNNAILAIQDTGYGWNG